MAQFLIPACADDILGILGDALELSDVGILLLDHDLRARFMNSRLAELFGLPVALVATAPTFRELIQYTEITCRGEAASDELVAAFDLREAAVRAGSIPPTQLTLGDGRRLLSSCTACANGGRMLTYTDITRELQREAQDVAGQINAELRFSSETMEEQAGFLAAMAEAADENVRKIEASRLALEQEITERCQLEAQLRDLATTDGLTGILNRSGFRTAAARTVEWPCKADRRHAVLMLDVDHFKAINDRYGHAGGDLALQHLVATLRVGTRQNDLLGRLGGEEFAILLPETTPALADLVAERLRHLVATAPLTFGDRLIEMTISIGAATKQESDRTLDQLLARADAALYRAKGSGRNRVVSDHQAIAA